MDDVTRLLLVFIQLYFVR